MSLLIATIYVSVPISVIVLFLSNFNVVHVHGAKLKSIVAWLNIQQQVPEHTLGRKKKSCQIGQQKQQNASA